MIAALVDLILGLWWVAIFATVASVLFAVAAWNGALPHFAGMVTASALLLIGASYWIDIAAGPSFGTIDMRRGAGLALWPAVAWIAVWLTRRAKARR